MRFLTRLVGLVLAVLLLIGAVLLMVGSRDPVTLRLALIPQEVQLPLHLRDLFEREERLEVLPNDLAAVQAFMAGNINA